jgi:hypothetical protein
MVGQKGFEPPAPIPPNQPRDSRPFSRQFRRILGLRELVRHQFVEARAAAVYTAPGQNGCDWICDAD